MSDNIQDFKYANLSVCCGADLYDYHDGFGICGECKEHSMSEADYEQMAHINWLTNEK